MVLPGSAGTHVVCVCSYHQNPKLMIVNSQISTQKSFKRIVGNEDGNKYNGEIKYHHLIAQMMCNPPLISCWQGECTECEDTQKLEDTLIEIFEELDIETITYKQWESTDRTDLIVKSEVVSDFVQSLIGKLKTLKTHQFINNQQTRYFYDIKETLPVGKALAVGDFSQNYSFVYQDAVQGIHWCNTSCTLHPWLCFYKGADDKIHSYSLLFISDYLTHDTVAVYAFQSKLVTLLKQKLLQESIQLKEIEYFSDGCAHQYKNKKNFLNLTYHNDDFGIPANWSFSATSHGKGPWDGVAGCVKREATLESLRRPEDNHIQNAIDFYNFTKEKFKNICVEFIPSSVISELNDNILEERFQRAKTIRGTLGYHTSGVSMVVIQRLR